MEKVIPYEHRGKAYRKIEIANAADARAATEIFRAESDLWLKKIIALKLLSVAQIYNLEISKGELAEAIRCRIE